jgi:hypothetical protein
MTFNEIGGIEACKGTWENRSPEQTNKKYTPQECMPKIPDFVRKVEIPLWIRTKFG